MRHRRTTPFRILPAFIVSVSPALVAACGTCNGLGGDALAISHPRAIEIAVATRKVIDEGRFSDRAAVAGASLSGGRDTTLDKIPAPILVKAWAEGLRGPVRHGRPTAVHFLFVDTEQSCGLLVRGGAAIFEAMPAFHAEGRIVTTRAAFHALASGALGITEAQRLGLVIVEGDPHVATLLRR